ncbi:acetamidase/formamidase family protein [Desulfotruncus alcoholivorax]|uniref:acetamidase/formamidase family protein n=1 Tax=Desulfotruncus alcoholivorax TaxID=265477 RepID=UPI00041417DA|nr:acetamidase/formamidase family protein [Desulfotruncus alcoholivorax]
MRIAAKKTVFNMDKNNLPVAKVSLPARLAFETRDCFEGQLKSAGDTLETLNFDRVNPATGPVYLEGVQPGDVIAVHIESIQVTGPGVMVAAPGAGVLGEQVTQSQTLMVPIEDGVALFKGLALPLNPMIGVIGVAPAGDPVPCGTPGSHGGNMDTTLIRPGSTLYLPVQVDGALLAMGDLHAAMGDGEIMVSGVEVAGTVEITVTLAKGWQLNNPLVVTGDVVATIASAHTLDEAVDTATREMAMLLQQKTGLTLNEAGMLMSACGNAEICQVVDPLKTARFSMPRNIVEKLGLTDL